MSQKSKTLLETRRFRVVQLQQDLPNSKVVTREVVRHTGSVVMLPLIDDDHVCLIRNYRIAVDDELIELPAGTLEIGEDPLAAAQRELIEETGYRSTQLELIQSFFVSPGILDERMQLYVATNLVEGEPERETGEQIQNFIVSWREAVQMVQDGRIHDAKTIIGLLYYDRFRRND